MYTDRWGEEITNIIHDVCERHIVGVPWGGREVNMTEYLDTWKLLVIITRREIGMRVSRLKTQFMDIALKQNES